MFCKNCGKEIENGVCPNCRSIENTAAQQPFQQEQPIDEKAVYRAAAKKYWYAFLIPVLFFVPIMKENKNEAGNIDVANNALWILILNIAATILNSFFSGFLGTMFSLVSSAVGVFAFVMFICAVSGNGIKVPCLGDIKIIKQVTTEELR